MDKFIKEQVNLIFSKWNPLDVPELLAEYEYSGYIDEIISVGQDRNKIRQYLIHLINDIFGLEYEESNKYQSKEIDKVTDEIMSIYHKV
ncbi:hypothetical protein N5094_03875 [Shewanella putrefaciens]|uniref:hypothetical protein n=1 Tax=Shewanella putrefaciens TaxID=24 RepID=UPI0021C2133A|nr:hypothetical protein [Shewanella putrefaciens]UXK09386.1 hypothetical protein N5094_03875 [Shewanella putrefaciens]